MYYVLYNSIESSVVTFKLIFVRNWRCFADCNQCEEHARTSYRGTEHNYCNRLLGRNLFPLLYSPWTNKSFCTFEVHYDAQCSSPSNLLA